MGITTPKITIIMPFFNAAPFLDASISSILKQTFTDYEFIIINDASTDGSDAIVKKYLHDMRLVYISNDSNRGIVHNLNAGIRISRADIIARMDGDDVSLPTRLEQQYRYLRKHTEVYAVGCYAQIIDEAGQPTGRIIQKPSSPADVEKFLFKYLTVIHGTAMVRKSLYAHIGLYRKEWLHSEDVDFTYRAVYTGYQFANLSEVLYQYRYHSISTAHNSTKNALRAFRLRLHALRSLAFHPSFSDLVFMVCQLVIGVVLTGRMRQKTERFYKALIKHE